MPQVAAKPAPMIVVIIVPGRRQPLRGIRARRRIRGSRCGSRGFRGWAPPASPERRIAEPDFRLGRFVESFGRDQTLIRHPSPRGGTRLALPTATCARSRRGHRRIRGHHRSHRIRARRPKAVPATETTMTAAEGARGRPAAERPTAAAEGTAGRRPDQRHARHGNEHGRRNQRNRDGRSRGAGAGGPMGCGTATGAGAWIFGMA